MVSLYQHLNLEFNINNLIIKSPRYFHNKEPPVKITASVWMKEEKDIGNALKKPGPLFLDNRIVPEG